MYEEDVTWRYRAPDLENGHVDGLGAQEVGEQAGQVHARAKSGFFQRLEGVPVGILKSNAHGILARTEARGHVAVVRVVRALLCGGPPPGQRQRMCVCVCVCVCVQVYEPACVLVCTCVRMRAYERMGIDWASCACLFAAVHEDPHNLTFLLVAQAQLDQPGVRLRIVLSPPAPTHAPTASQAWTWERRKPRWRIHPFTTERM
jgi:hypothetical protein